MDEHDIARLSDEDFEQVCKDLFEEILGIPLEVFARGPDDGVDLRGRDADGGTVVVQCKHWWRSPRTALVQHVDNVERHKVDALQPARYVLATSCDLTVRAKDRLFDLLQPFVGTPSDVYGIQEIAAELRKRPHVVRRHPALWFHGAEALSALLNKGLFERSRDLVEDIKATMRVFVPGHRFRAASEMLDEQHLCLIGGLPGYGKTTLAHALAATYAARGYRVVAIGEATDIDDVWDDDERQFFYYDDFLGRTSIERRRYAGTPRLLRLMTRVRATPGKRLVLTTREYVLAEARDRDEGLNDADLDVVKCTLELNEYDHAMRTGIVRNHVMRSALPAPAKAAMTRREVLDAVARHRHFNPRVVVMAVTAAAHELVSADDLPHDILGYLDDPGRVWRHIVDNQLTDAAVDLLAVLLSFEERTRIDIVERAWVGYRRHDGREADRREFYRAVRTLNGTMVLTGKPAGLLLGETWIGFHNPSVLEFATQYFLDGPVVTTALLDSAVWFRQVEALWDRVCPYGADPSPTVVALAEVFERAARRTFSAPTPGTAFSDPPGFEATLVTEMAGKLGTPRMRALLNECLPDISVSFEAGYDESDLSNVWMLVDELSGWKFERELCDLLLPAVAAIDDRDIDAMFTLTEVLAHHNVPAAVSRAVDAKVVAVVERALAGPPPDDDTWWTLGMAVSRRRLDVSGIPAEWLVVEPD